MVVTIVSECTKKSAIRSRRILSGYLTQVSRRTWTGHLSKNGMDALTTDLKKVATRSNSIACFLHKGLRPSTLLWIIGNSNSFDEDGTYSYSTFHEKRLVIDSNLTDEYKLLKLITMLAGLCHDLGKATIGFQNKLKASLSKKVAERDIIRHEISSALILNSVLRRKSLVNLTNKDSIKLYFEQYAQADLNLVSEDLQNYLIASKEKSSVITESNCSMLLERAISMEGMSENPLDTSLLWLVLTHHKLLDGEIKQVANTKKRQRSRVKSADNGQSSSILKMIISKKFLNQNFSNDVQDFLTLTHTGPWKSQKWLSTFSSLVTEVNEILNRKPNILKDLKLEKSNSWITHLVYKARPSLIYSDYLSSINKETCEQQEPDLITYANTKEDGGYVWADSLEKHLLDVQEKSGQIFHKYFTEFGEQQLSYLEQSELPAQMSPRNVKNAATPFCWQDIAASHLRSSVNENEPSFGIILSKTGAGKTKGAPLILSSAGNKVRIAVLLGRRSLVTQTYKSYISELIGFKNEDVSMLIGARTVDSQIQKRPHENQENKSFDMGSDAFLDEKEYEFVSSGSNLNLENEVEDIFNKSNEQQMLNSPISVMTIDYMISAVSQTKGVDTKLLYILKSTDLILDEIDDYDAKDLISIGKLLYLSGYYGRKVIIASATSSSVILSSLMESYYLGIGDGDSERKELSIYFVADNEPYIEFNRYESLTKAKENLSEFTNKFAETLKSQPIQHKIKFIDVESEIDKDIDFKKVDSALMLMHQQHHQVTSGGIKVSVGFVRFNHVKNAQHYALHLSEQEFDNTYFKIVCYHSQMLNADRYVTETLLDELLNRNTNDVVEHPIITELVEQAMLEGRTNVKVIVSTTSIQETGRDHDYDWALTEPLSDKSVVQLAGRVWRHRRDKRSVHPAIGIFSNTIKGYQGKERPWGYPGIESDSVKGDKKVAAYPVSVEVSDSIKSAMSELKIGASNILPNIGSETVLSHSHVSNGISPSTCLLNPDNLSEGYIYSLELIRQNRLLSVNHRQNELFTLNGFLTRNDSKLTSTHWSKTRFRTNELRTINIYQDKAIELRISESRWKSKEGIPVNIKHRHPELLKMDKFLFNYSVEDKVTELAIEFGKVNSPLFFEVQFSAQVKESQVNELNYSNYIGFWS
ncbi:HD domain-containing protein [Pseudoalteromonas sp. OFAV1]|uniref:HD domain-containing protein n=1 Tax=Pseudoalteromonas sp. OFAV1 TaxID=2908892 RepID=UPI002E22CDF4